MPLGVEVAVGKGGGAVGVAAGKDSSYFRPGKLIAEAARFRLSQASSSTRQAHMCGSLSSMPYRLTIRR